MYLIGITGKARSGKDTIADHLALEHWFEIYSFAQPIKRGIQSTFMLDPDTPNEDREAPTWTGLSKRQMYQLFGTEFGREMIDPDIWIKCADRAIAKIQHSEMHNPGLFTDTSGVVIPDVRFDNEAEFILSRGGIIIEVVRPINEVVNKHVSEDGISRNLITTTIMNDNTVDDLHNKVGNLFTSGVLQSCKNLSAA